MGNVAVGPTEKCVRIQLEQFGRTKVERGDEPEAGKVRLFLVGSSGLKSKATAAVYMNYVRGKQSFTSLWMDAANDRLGNAIWRKVKLHCHVH
jgi:hypothetical protein